MRKLLQKLQKRLRATTWRLAAFLLAASAASGVWAADAATIIVSGSTVTIANETATQYANKDLTFNSTWQEKTFTLPSGTDLAAGTVVKITSISFAKATSTSGTMADKLKIDGWVSASATVTASGFGTASADKYTYSFADLPVYMVAGAGKVVKFLNSDGTEKNTSMGFCCGANSYQYIQDLKWTVSNVPYVPVIEVVAEIIATQNGAQTSIGNANSSNPLALCGVTGWLDTANSKNEAIVLENDGNNYAVAVNNANSVSDGNEQHSLWKKLSGSGTLTVEYTASVGDKSGTYPVLDIYDASEFTGSIAIGGVSRAPNLGVLFCNANESLPETRYQLFRESVTSRIYVSAGRTTENNAAVTIPAGKTWSATGGIKVMGELIVSDGATAPSIGSGSTGTVAVLSGTGTVKGIASDDVKLMTASGSTLAVADTSSAQITIPADSSHLINAGTLDFSGCTALAALNLYVGTGRSTMLGTITLPANTGMNVIVAKSANDGDTVSVVMTAISGANYYVVDTDGSYYDATVAQDGSNLVFTPTTLKIDGVATYCDATFNGTVSMAFTTDNVVVRNPSSANAVYNNSANDKTTGIKVYNTPWLGTADLGNITTMGNFQSQMTLAVVGQMPSVQDNAIFIHLGGSSGTNKGFLIYRLAEDDKVAVAYNEGHDVTDLTTMTVPNAATARHVYIITKVDDTTANKSVFTIYLDGIKWKTQEVSPVLSMTGGVQIGSDFQAGIRSSDQANGMRIKRVMPSGAAADTAVDTTGYVNVIRIYDRIISDAEIAAYSAAGEYPYVSPHGSSARTFDTANENWVEDGATDWANTYEETTTQAEAPRAGSALTVNTSVATTISANLESTVSYDSLTVNGTGATFAKVNGYGGVISVAGSSVIGAPVTINAGALVLGGPVTITEGGSVTFNYSDYEVASADVIQLTGEMEEAESGKITIIPPADQHYTYTYGYSGTQYVITPAVAVAVLNHKGTLTGYTTAEAAFADADSGDTVTLQTAYLTPSTAVATYAADKTGVNVIVKGYTIAPVVSDGTTTWTTPSAYIWTGAGSDNNWTTPANWGLASGYPNDASASVYFGANAVVTVDSSVSVFGIYTPDNTVVTLQRSGNSNPQISGISDLGLEATVGDKFVLDGINLSSVGIDDNSSHNWYGDIEIAENANVTNTIYCNCNGQNNPCSLNLMGNITGSGNLQLARNGKTSSGSYSGRGGVSLYGNNEAFAGTCTIRSGSSTRGPATFCSATSGSGLARWIYPDGIAANNAALAGTVASTLTGVTVKLGTYEGNSYIMGFSDKGDSTIEIGGANLDFTCSLSATLNSVATDRGNDNGYPTLKKVGTGTMTFGDAAGNPCFGVWDLNNGTVKFANDSILSYKSSNGRTTMTPTFKFTGGVVAFDSSHVVDISALVKNSTSAVAVDVADDQNIIWANTLDNSNTGGFTKKGSGTLTLSAVPAYTGTTTVEAGVLEVPQGTTISELALTGGKIAVALEGAVSDTTVLTVTSLADGTTLTADDIVLSDASTTLTLDTETTPGSVIVKATREVKNYVWTGATSTAFDTLSNWLVNDAVPTEAPYAAIDTIEFPADGAPWTVALSEDVEIASVAVNGAVTLTGGKLLANAFTGSAAITLGGNAGIGDYEPSATMTIANPIVVSGTGNSLNANTVYVTYSGAISSADDTAELTLYGAVECVNLTGNNSGLQGQVYMNGHVTLASSTAGSANAKWVIANTTGDYDNPIRANSVQFGELSGTYTHVKAAMNNYTHSMYVGALGTSFTLGGKFSDNNSGRAETIYKVGAGTMTFTGRYVNWLNLNEGTVYVTSTDATVVHNGVAFNGGVLQLASGVTQDFSGLVQSSTAAVKVGVDDGASLTWATALNANNTVAEIEKYGAGTLTLTYAPAWDSTKVTVAEGSLVMPATSTVTLGDNTIVSARDTENGTMTLAYATTVALTVPAVDGTTVAVTYVDSNGDTQTVAESDTANVYLVPVGTEVTVTYTGTTGTVVTSGGTITGTYHEATEVDTTGVTVASAAVWVGNAVENGDNLWSTATNWDPEGVPGQTTLVEFPAANSEYTVILTGWSPCAGMSVEGTVTVQQQSDTVNWLAIQSGAIIGDGTLKLNNIGVSNDTGATVTIAPDLVVLTTGNDGDSNGQKQTTFANGAFTFNGDVTVDGWMFTVGAVNTYNGTVTVNGRFRQVWGGENVHYRPVFNGDVVIGQDVYMDNYSDAGFEFNGGTVTGLGTGGTLHTGNGSNTKITGQGLTVAGNVVIGSGGTQTPVEAPVLMRPGSTLTIRNYVSVTSVNPVDAAYCAVTDNESSPRVFTCSWKAEAKPEIDMTVASPVTVTTDGVKFAVSASSLIEGLYYRVKAVDGDDNESAAASTKKVKYTGNNASALNFTAPLPLTDGVLYYTIEASDE